LWERIWHKQISMGVQQIPALHEQKCVLPCCQWGDIRWNWPLYTARLCQRSQTKAIWSTAACPSTNNTARGDGYSVTTVQFTQSKTNTSLQLLIRKGFRFTNPHTQGYGRDLRLRHVLCYYIWVTTAHKTSQIQSQRFTRAHAVLPKLTRVTYIRIYLHCMLLWRLYSSHGLWFQS